MPHFVVIGYNPVTFMAITIGQHLGSYEITALLGKGGMGEVYRAHDINLKRDVAIKILPDEFSRDPHRVSRFQREAEVLASLNHANIAQIYGFEGRVLAMELVEGDSPQGPMPFDEAWNIASQIAEALEYAHEKGIVHRDLKPANVKVTPDGVVKLLDFGLAKALGDFNDIPSSDPANSPTVTRSATVAGTVMGTAGYMAPEQAKGKPVDKRADIWAWGVLLYELLTGERLFQGEDASDTLVQVMTKQPDFERVPAKARRLLQDCLLKDPKERLRDIGDAQRFMAEPPKAGGLRQGRLSWAAAGLFAVGIALWALWPTAPAPAGETLHLQIALPENVTLSAASPFAVSPDGRKLVFLAVGSDNVTHLWLRFLDSGEVRSLPGTETGPTAPPPFWSPDSRFVVLPARGKLTKVDISGGPVQAICDLSQTAAGGTWNHDGVIIFSQTIQGLMRVSATGGSPSPLTRVESSRQETSHNYPFFLPDRRHFLYLRNSRKPENSGVYIGSLDAKPEDQSLQRLVNTSLGVSYVPSTGSGLGYLLFRRESALVAQPFDDRNLALSGEPVVVAEQLGSFFGFGLFSVSENGVLIYRTGGVAQTSELVVLDRQGKVVSGPGEPGVYTGIAISPDGTRAVINRRGASNADQNLWLIDLSRGTFRRLNVGPEVDARAVWSPDGTRIAFGSKRAGAFDLYVSPADGVSDAELLLKTDLDKTPLSWSRDFLLYATRDPKTNDDLWVLPLHGERRPIPFANTEFNESAGRFSPDGRWVAYVSNESGRNEVYVRAFSPTAPGSAGSGSITIVSRGGASDPRWNADGKELFYVGQNGSMMAVDVAPGPVFQPGSPRSLFQLPAGTVSSDTASDGRTLAVVPLQQASQAPFNVILNWQTGLKK